MKKDQVPQDDARLLEGRTRELCYALNDNGEYVQVLSSGWEPKNIALQQAWSVIDDQVREALERVRAGEISPLAIFMARGQFDLNLLSDTTDIPKRKIRAHLKPEGFSGLDLRTLEKYADAFNLTVDEIVHWPETTASFLASAAPADAKDERTR